VVAAIWPLPASSGTTGGQKRDVEDATVLVFYGFHVGEGGDIVGVLCGSLPKHWGKGGEMGVWLRACHTEGEGVLAG
jgi:hypothetical protein